MYLVSVTIHDHQDLDCRTHTLTQHFQSAGQTLELTPEQMSKVLISCRDEAIRNHRNSYPRGRSFSIPVVEIEVTPNVSAADMRKGDVHHHYEAPSHNLSVAGPSVPAFEGQPNG